METSVTTCERCGKEIRFSYMMTGKTIRITETGVLCDDCRRADSLQKDPSDED